MKTIVFLGVGIVMMGLAGCNSTGQMSNSAESAATRVIELPSLPDEAIPLTLTRVRPGEFMMGSQPDDPGVEDNELPAHTVTLTNEFYMAIHEVTQAQWNSLMDNNPSTRIGPNLPVNRVSYEQANRFLDRLNGLRNDSRFRLPTEAEWEYAARGGTQTLTWFGDDRSTDTLEEYVWFRNNSDGEIQPVGEKPANPFGLYDVHGNVWEWCYDFFGPYTQSATVNPTGPDSGTEHVIRGGSWMARPEYIRAADRGKFPPDATFHTGGFRIVWSEWQPE